MKPTDGGMFDVVRGSRCRDGKHAYLRKSKTFSLSLPLGGVMTLKASSSSSTCVADQSMKLRPIKPLIASLGALA